MVTRMTAMQRKYRVLEVMHGLKKISMDVDRSTRKPGLSMREIAYWVHIKPSGYFKRVLDECTVAGWLEKQEFPYRTGIISHRYRITEAGVRMVRSRVGEPGRLL